MGSLEAQRTVKRPAVALSVPDVRGRYVDMVNGLDRILMDDPERGREELRGIVSDRIRLKPDVSGKFLWAEYAWV